MGNKIQKLLSIMLIVVLCMVVFVVVGQGNFFAQGDVEIDTTGNAVEESEKEADSSSTTIILVKDPRHIDGTAYAFAVLPQIVTQSEIMDKDRSYAVERSIEAQDPVVHGRSNLLVANIVTALLTIALVLGLALVYNRTKKKGTKNYKIAGIFLVLIMIFSIFTVMQINENTDKGHDSIISINDASGISESSAYLSGDVDIPKGIDNLEVSFEWDSDSGHPYSNETSPFEILSDGYVEDTITGLSQETTYYYRIKAVGKDYIYYSQERSFRTLLGEEIYYVHMAATGTGDGSSWENAFTDLEEAIEAADSKDEILVALSEDPDEIGLAIRLRKSESGDILIDETLVIGPNDTLEGSGTIDSDVVVTGTHSPGHSPGINNITGDYTISGTLEIEIGGLSPGPGSPNVDDGYDQINVTGNITLGGTLDVVLINDFKPEVGQTFDFLNLTDPASHTISGAFANATGLFGFGDGTLYFEIVEKADKVQLEVKKFGGGGLQLKAIGAHAIGIGKVLCDYFSDTSYSGSLENVDILGLISGSVSFSVTKDVEDVDLDGDPGTPGDQYEDATLLTFSFTSPTLYVGKSGFGLYITSGELGIANLKASDGSSWLAVLATDIGGILTLPGLSATLGSFSVKINKGYDGVSALDWTLALDLDDNGTYGNDPLDIVDFDGNTGTTDDKVMYTSEIVEVSGSLAGIDIFGLITGGANFAVNKQFVDVDSDGNSNPLDGVQYDDATMVTFALDSLDLKAGASGFGISIDSGTVGMAAIESGGKKWVAVNASGLDATITLPGMSATVSDIGFEINRAEGGASALNWTTAVDTDPAGGWTSAGVVDPGENLPSPVDMDITYTSEFLKVAGSLTSLDISGFVSGETDFEIVPKIADVDADDSGFFSTAEGDLDDADVVLLKLEVTDVFIGVPDSIGFSLSSGMLALASIRPSDPVADDRSWLSVSASIGNAELTGIEGLTAKGSFDLEVNRAFTGIAVAPGDALDWTNDVNLDYDSLDGTSFIGDEDEVGIGGHAIEHTADFLQTSGDLDIDLFGFVKASVSFEFVQRQVDVDVDGDQIFSTADGDLDNADLVMIDIQVKDVFAGIPDSIGFALESGYLALATIKPSDPVADDRSWLALNATVTNAELKGIEGLTAIGGLEVDINQAFAGTVAMPDDVLDWANSVNLEALSTDGASFAGDEDQIIVGGHVIDHDVDLLEASGYLTLDLFGFFYVEGSVAFKKTSATVTVTDGAIPVPNVEDVDVELITVGVEVDHAFAGMNGPYWKEDTNTNGEIDVPGEINEAAMGLSLSGVEFGLAMMKHKTTDPETETDLRSWTALKAEVDSLEFVGIEGLTAKGSVEVQINTGGGTKLGVNNDTVVDLPASWDNTPDPDGLKIDTGDTEGTPILLDYNTDYLKVDGTLELDLFGFFYVEGNFAIEKTQTTVTVTDGAVPVPNEEDVLVEILTIGIEVDHAFAGMNGPYWKEDTNDNGEIDLPGEINEAAMGLSLSGVEFGLAMMKHKATDPETETDLRSWTALKADVDSLEFVGIEGLTAEGSVGVQISTGDGTKLGVDNDTVVDFQASWDNDPDPDGLNIDTGDTEGTPILIDFTTDYLKVEGTLKLDLFGFFYVEGNFAVEKDSKLLTVWDGLDHATDEELNCEILKIGVVVDHAFAGMNGPYWKEDTNDNGDIDVPDEINEAAMGLSLSGVEFALAFMKVKTNDPENETDLRNWTALKAEVDSIEFVGISGLIAEGSVNVDINTGGGTKASADNLKVVDFPTSYSSPNGLEVDTGDVAGTPIKLDYTTDYLRVNGTLRLDAFGFFYIYGGFAFEKTSKTVTVWDGLDHSTDEEVNVETLTVGAVITHAFAGVDGPYWMDDTNNPGVFDKPDEVNVDAMGLSLSNVKIALALMKVKTNDPETETDLRNWTSFSATTGEVELVGVDSVSASGTATVQLNDCGGTKDDVDNDKYVDFPVSYPVNNGLEIDVGIAPPLLLNFDGYYLYIHLQGSMIAGGLTLGGSFGFEMGDDFIGISASLTIEFKDAADEVILELSLDPAALLLNQNGIAAQLGMSITIGATLSPISFEGSATFYLNTTGEDVTEIAGATVDLALEPGEIEIIKLTVGILKIDISDYVFFQATNVTLDFTATGSEYLIQFYGDEGADGGLEIKFNDSFPLIAGWGGSIGNFAISANITFHVLPGFEISIEGPSDATAFGLPSFLPIVVELLSFKYNPGAVDTTTHELLDPTDFTIKFSGGLAGDDVWPITCQVDGMEIDIGLMANKEFPIVDLGGFEIGIEDFDLGPVTIGGGLTLGMVDVETSPGNTETAFYGGIEGKFKYSGIGGGLSLIVCQYGPILAKFSIGGLVLGPTGFVLGVEDGGFSFGGDPWPSVDSPEELLENPVFSDPFDIDLATITARVEQAVINGEPTWNDSFTMAATGNVTNLYVQGMIEGNVTLAANLGFTGPDAGLKLLVNGTIDALGMPLGFAVLLIDLSDILVPQIDMAYSVPAPGNPLGFLYPSSTTLLASIDTSGILEMPIVGLAVFLDEAFTGTLALLMDDIAEDLESDHSEPLAQLMLDVNRDDTVSTGPGGEDEQVITGTFMVDSILGNSSEGITGILPLDFDALSNFDIDALDRAIDLVTYLVPALVHEASLLTVSEMEDFLDDLAEVVIDAALEGLDAGWDTFNPSLKITGRMQPIIFGIPLGEPVLAVDLFINKDVLSFSFEGSIRDLLLQTVFKQFGGEILASLPPGLEGFNDQTSFAFTLDLPDELIDAIIAGLVDDGSGGTTGLLQLLLEAINPFTGWEVLIASTITFNDFKLGSASGFIFGPQLNAIGEYDPTPVFADRVICLDSTPTDPSDSTPDPVKLQRTLDETNLIPVNTQEQFDDIVKFGGLLLTGQLFLPDIISDPIAVVTTMPVKASTTITAPSPSDFELTLEAVEFGPNFNDVIVRFQHEAGIAAAETAFYDVSNIRQKVLIVTVEDGESTAEQIAAAITAEGTFTAVATVETSIIDIDSVNPIQTSGGASGPSADYASVTIGSAAMGFEMLIEATATGSEFNDVIVVFEDRVLEGEETAFFDETNPSNKVLRIAVEDGVTTAAQVAAAINSLSTFSASVTVGTSAINIDLVNPPMTANGVNGIDWTLPEVDFSLGNWMNFTSEVDKIKAYIDQIIAGLKRQSEWAKLQIYIASPAVLFDLGDYIDTAGAAHAKVTSPSGFDLTIEATEYGFEYNDVAINFLSGAALSVEYDDSDPNAKSLNISVIEGTTIAKDIAAAFEDLDQFTAYTTVEGFVVTDVTELSNEVTAGGFIEEKSTPIDFDALLQDKKDELLEILNAGYIEGYSELMLLGIDLGETFIEGTINGIRAEADIPWLAGLTASLETGWKTVSRNQLIYDLVTSPIAEVVVDLVGIDIGMELSEFFDFLLDPAFDDVDIIYPVAGFEAALDSENFLDWMVENFGLPSEVVPVINSEASYDFFFGAYTPGFGEPEDSGVKRQGGFRLEGSLNLTGVIDDAWFEFEIEFFNPLEHMDLGTFFIPNFIARASVPNLSLPGIIPNTNMLTISDFYIEIIKDAEEGLHFELEGSVMLLGLRFNADAEFDLSDGGWFGGMRLEMLVGVEGFTDLGDETTPASLEIISPGMDNDFRIDSVKRATAKVTSDFNGFNLYLEAVSPGSDFNDVTIEFVNGPSIEVDYDDSDPLDKVLTITVVDGVSTAEDIATVITNEGPFTATTEDPESVIRFDTMNAAQTSGGGSGAGFNHVRVRIIDDGSITDGSATAVYRSGEIVITIQDGFTPRSAVIAAVNALHDWTVGATELSDGNADGELYLTNALADVFDFELSAEFILLINTTGTVRDIYWNVPVEDTLVQIEPYTLQIHADGEVLFLGMELKGFLDFEVSSDGLDVSVFAGLGLGPLGSMTFSGVLIIGDFGDADDFGIVGRLEVDTALGDGFGILSSANVRLEISAYFLLEINTCEYMKTVSVPDFNVVDGLGASGDLVVRDVDIEPGILVHAQGTLDFIGLLEANANVTIELRGGYFYLGGRAAISLAANILDMEVSLNSHITSNGLTVEAWASIDSDIVDVITISASGDLVINTRNQWVTVNGKDFAPKSFLLDLTGEVAILEVLRFDTGFKVQVGGGQFKHEAVPDPKADLPAGNDANLSPGEWAVSFGVDMSFFGLAEISADGWFNHEGHFAVYLGGYLQIGSKSFGIMGDFEIEAAYNGSVFTFSGDGTAKVVLFGWDIANAEVNFDYDTVSGLITIHGEIHLDFWLFSVDVEKTFTIGFFKLPPPVYLAGSTSTPQLPGGQVDTDGNLYLNMGSRAHYRDLEESVSNETFYVTHVSGISGNETVLVSCFGRTQKFSGVERIIANGGSGDDMIVLNYNAAKMEGVLASVDLRGGAGSDVIVHEGPGGGTNNIIRGDDGDDYLELGNAITVSVDLRGGAHNDYIQGGPNNDTIYGDSGDDQILGGGGNDTIYGNDGSDMITGGFGLDSLYGHGGSDVFYWTWGDGQDSVINGGSDSDTMVITADDTNEDIAVSNNAGDIVITWLSETPVLALTGISIESLDINLASGSDDFTLEDILGSGVTSIRLDLGDYDASDLVADTVVLKGSSSNDSYVLNSAGGLVNVSRVGVVDVLISNAARTPGNEDELIIRTYEGEDTINAAAVAEDLMAMTFEAGIDDDILIGTRFSDVLDSGSGSDTVTGSFGQDIFIDDSGPDDTDTLVEILDSDMSLFDNLFVVGAIMADDGTDTFFKSSIIAEQGADPADPLFPAPVVFPLEDTGDVFAIGAEVENLLYNNEPIFERAYLTAGDSNNLMVVGDFNGEITVGGVTMDAWPWTGEATLDNGANHGSSGDEYNEYYILNLNGASGARISILDSGESDGYDELYIYCTDDDDKVWLNTIRSGTEVTGIVVVGEPYGSGFVQKMTVVGGVEVLVFYLLDINDDKVQRTDAAGNLIYDLTDPKNPVPIYVETTLNTGVRVMVKEPNPDRDDVSFRHVERVTINTMGGKDFLMSDDTDVPTVVNLGGGDDTIIIGSVPQINDPGNITLEYLLGIPIADTENMTNGNFAVMTIYGEDGDDEFEVNHNLARQYMHGGAHDDTFVINTFLTLPDSDNSDEIANLNTLFGGTGTNRYEYLQNAPVHINGGTGTDIIVINGTPIGDIFIVTDKYVAGAGRIVYFTEIEKISVNAAGGADEIYVLSSDPNLEVTIRGGSGDDTIHLGGDPPTLLFDPPAYSYQPPSYLVQDPPETVYEIITWDIGQTTVSVDWNWWTYNFLDSDANDVVRNYLNGLVNVMQFFIPGLELATSVDDIIADMVANNDIHYSYGYGRWWIFDREVYVTFDPPAFDLQYPTQGLPPPRTIVPDPVVTDPGPFAFKADTTFDLAGILGLVIIDGGDAFETDGDQVIIHNQNSNAVIGSLTDIGIFGLGLGLGIEYESLENMTILLGDYDDTLTIHDTFSGGLTVSMGGGNDTTNVEAISAETVIMGGAGNDTINLGRNINSLSGILENITVQGDFGQSETVDNVAYEPLKHDPIQSQVYINSAPTLDASGNVIAYAPEEKARIIFEQGEIVWVRVVVLDSATGQIIEDLVQEKDSSGNLLWFDANGDKTTNNPGGYPPSLLPVNRTEPVPFTRSKIVDVSGAGSDTLNVYDTDNSGDVAATLTDSTLSVTSMPGLLTYYLNELSAYPVADIINVNLGSGNDVFNVQSTSVITNLMLNSGDERIYVSNLAALDLLTETDFLMGTLDDILGTLNIDAGSGRHLLMISDKDNAVGDSDVVITDEPVVGLPSADISITGLAPAPITYKTDASSGTFAEGITMWTGSGDDTITIHGTHRRDLQDPLGNDIRTITTLNTGLGDDTVTVSLDTDTDGFFVLNTQEDNDVVNASSSTLGFIIFGGLGGLDEITGGEGDDVIFGDCGRVYYLNDTGAIVTVIGNGGPGDTTDGITHTNRLEVPADPPVGGVDIIFGNGGDDVIFGCKDDDLIYGGAGNDQMAGGDGDDYMEGGTGNDEMLGDNGLFGSVTLTGGSGDDIMLGGLGEDEMYGQSGHDRMWGNADDDTMWGGDDSDWVFGNSGEDFMYGEHGADILFGDNGTITITGGVIESIETTEPLIGGDDTISCGLGNDIVIGGTARDTIYGNEGNDLMFGDHAKVEKIADFTIDATTLPVPSFLFTSIFTGAGDGGDDDVMHGNSGHDILLGGQGDDDMYGDEGDDDLIGGHNVAGGIDELDSTPGFNDRMDGGPGNDWLAGDNAKIIRRTDSESPRIRVLMGTLLYDETDNVQVTGIHQINPTGAVERDITLYDHSDDPTPDTFGNDYMAGGPDDDVMFGQLGDDIMQGDAMIAESFDATDPSVEGVDDGDDYMEGNGGNDLIFGNLGQDDIIGGSSNLFSLASSNMRPDGSDTIFGGAGTDISRNDLGDTSDNGHAQDADMILGDNGNIYRIIDTENFLTFNYDNYTDVNGLKIIVRVAELLDYTPGGLDYLPTAAESKNDIGAPDEIHGESGDDFLYGMVENDILFGEGQDDDLIGGYGCDWISGGTGQDGVLGDDGRIYTSRNGTEEPLYGIDDLSGELDKDISSPGKVQQATINVEGELRKTVNLTPFKLGDPNDLDYSHKNFDPQYADDIIYGGWGSDFLHGGDGDDAISGAEALEYSAFLIVEGYDLLDPQGEVVTSSYTEPHNPGNVLGFEAYRAEEFALYDEYNPRTRIFVGAGIDFLLNFHAKDINPNGSPAENNDGNDVIFGDLGNDWLVGGTGQDHLYGGYGCDLINADDDLDTNGGLNDIPDTDSSYEDFAYGGAGRDVLIANTGGDRLTDWAGEFNSYIVPYAPFGFFTISRAPQPQLMQFLYDLSESDGADPTRADDTGADPTRNGEPEGELGLVKQQDFDWRDQTGAPNDPQPGNIPGGSRDVLRSASFNDGSMEAFAPDSGIWEVNSGKLKVSAESIGGDAVSVFHIDDMLPIYFEIRAIINAEKPTGGWKSNAYVIFDYHSPTDFKFAGINIAINKIQMGRRTSDGWIVDVQKSCKLKPDTNYNMLVAINGTVVTVVVNGSEAFSYVFDPRIIDGYSYGLNQGMVGMGSDNSRGTFDNIIVQVLPPEYTFEATEDFTDMIDDLSFMPVEGDWEIVESCYEGVPVQDLAISLVDLGLNRGLEANCILELEATFNTQTMAGFVFDYYGPQDFKFVMIRTDTDQVIIGHSTSKFGITYDTIVEKPFRAGVDYTLFVSLKGSTVSISINGYIVWGHVYNAITVDGEFGLFTVNGVGSFDEVTVRNDDPAFRDGGHNMMAMSPPFNPDSAKSLTQEELSKIVEEAISLWIASGLVDENDLALLGEVIFEIVDLEGLVLGHTSGNTVQIDINAAGWVWFVDATPGVDEEFAMQPERGLTADFTSSAAVCMDLLTVVMHELGHVLLLEHTEDGLMAANLEPGMRLLPESSDSNTVKELMTIRNMDKTPSVGIEGKVQWEDKNGKPCYLKFANTTRMKWDILGKPEEDI